MVLQLTHRLARLPGCKEILAGIREAEIFELEKGAGARGCLEIWHQLSDQTRKAVKSLFLPVVRCQHIRSAQIVCQSIEGSVNAYPTHLLYRSIAYRISEDPLIFRS